MMLKVNLSFILVPILLLKIRLVKELLISLKLKIIIL